VAASHKPSIRGSASAALPDAQQTSEQRAAAPAPEVFWRSPNDEVTLLAGDSLEALNTLPEASFDVIFADPPYFLSNGGSTCKNGKRVKVDKGGWDKSLGVEENHQFNRTWLAACQRLLTPNGTMWVSGTSHVIYSVGFAMQQLGFKVLNEIVWEKPNPPPNLSCRYFTHSTETVLWAAKTRKSKHFYDYPQMRADNGGKQMKSVWRMTAPGKSEKVHGKHPTQKPLGLLERIISASCPEGGQILDPFNGSGTTGVAAARADRQYTGIDLSEEYLTLTRARILAEHPQWEKPAPAKKAKRKSKARLRAVK